MVVCQAIETEQNRIVVFGKMFGNYNMYEWIVNERFSTVVVEN